MVEERQKIPTVMSDLRKEIVHVPEVIQQCTGIRIYGHLIKSILFSTDAAIIANNDADAILAVYPFTPSTSVLKSTMLVSQVPVLAGVGGGLTNRDRSANMSLFAESEGALAVVVNGTADIETIQKIEKIIDVPIIYTVVAEQTDISERIQAGVDILNVSGGPETANIVRGIRKSFPEIPIMATGGPSDTSILEVIKAGANAVTFTPPTSAQLFKAKMDKYRKQMK